MSTVPQQLANAANAQLSTGPRTDAGKATSSRNGTTHGLASGFAVLPCEDQSEFETLAASLHAEFPVTSPHRVFLVDLMIQSRWRLLRINALESEVFTAMTLATTDEPTPYGRIAASLSKNPTHALALLQRYAAAAERSYFKAHRELTRSAREEVRAEEKAMDDFFKNTLFGPVPGPPLNLGTPPVPPIGFASQNASKPLGNLALRL